MASRSELAAEIFRDITDDMVQNMADKGLLNRFSELTAEGVDAPSAWMRAKSEQRIPIAPDQYARFREYTLLLGEGSRAPKPGPFPRGRTSAGAPDDVPHATDEYPLPKTPV